MDHTETFMRRALAQARSGGALPGGGPVGCVITLDGKIIAEGHNEVDENCDPTSHAEVVAIRAAGHRLGKPKIEGATLYSTLQPCGMCSLACIWAGVSHIVYGAERDQVHDMYFEDRHFDTMDFIRDAFKDDITLEGGVLSDECAELYYKPDDHPPEEEQANK